MMCVHMPQRGNGGRGQLFEARPPLPRVCAFGDVVGVHVTWQMPSLTLSSHVAQTEQNLLCRQGLT